MDTPVPKCPVICPKQGVAAVRMNMNAIRCLIFFLQIYVPESWKPVDLKKEKSDISVFIKSSSYFICFKILF